MSKRKLKKSMHLLAAPFLLLALAGALGFHIPELLMILAFIVAAPAGVLALWLYRPNFLRVS